MSYECVSSGALKLKNSKGKIKKNKKSKASKYKIDLATSPDISAEASENDSKSYEYHGQTKAETTFQRAQAKKQEKELLKIASSTHKDRIMKFNENLDKLTEHFDIPKVSWTK